jgi:hypothetical protein
VSAGFKTGRGFESRPPRHMGSVFRKERAFCFSFAGYPQGYVIPQGDDVRIPASRHMGTRSEMDVFLF